MGTENSAIRISLVLILFAPGCLSYDPADLPIREPAESQPVEFKPLRILFVIDCSQSMAVTDPTPAGRVGATQEIIQNFLWSPKHEFGLIRFDSHATGLTSLGFGPDLFTIRSEHGMLNEALARLHVPGGTTNYESALEMARDAIEFRLQKETYQSLSAASYHVVFLSDGQPFPVDYDNDFNTPERILQLVGQIVWLQEAYGASSIKLHFAYLNSNTPDSIAQSVAALHRELASKGGGDYLEFASGQEIDFSSIDFR